MGPPACACSDSVRPRSICSAGGVTETGAIGAVGVDGGVTTGVAGGVWVTGVAGFAGVVATVGGVVFVGLFAATTGAFSVMVRG